MSKDLQSNWSNSSNEGYHRAKLEVCLNVYSLTGFLLHKVPHKPVLSIKAPILRSKSGFPLRDALIESQQLRR